jgi:hypothetical protein
MPASDVLRATVARFKLNPQQQQTVFNFFDAKVTDPTVSLNDETIIQYYVSQDAEVQKIFDERFAGNKALRDAGKTEYSYSNYLALEQELQNDIRDAGFPPGFYDDPASLAKFIGGEVSRAELRDRAQAAYVAVRQADPNTVAELKNLYGVNEGELAAYFLDPTKALDAMGKRLTGQDLTRRVQAAQIGAQARTQAGMGLTSTQAEQLVAQGVTTQEAQQGFAAIRQQQELFQPVMAGEQQISQQEQIGAALGTNAEAAQRVATRRRRRQAEFERGGGFAASQTGLAGLRTAGQ